MERITATFTYAKDTKGTRVYEEVAELDNPIVGTIYLRKARLAGASPAKLLLSIEEVK